MIAISSHRPFSDSQIIAGHQINAFKSWLPVFDRIIYFGAYEPSLDSAKTCFVPCDGKPTIQDMARVAKANGRWSSIINADIIVNARAEALEAKLNEHRLKCGFSFRIPVGETERKDLGLDFFCADQDVWACVACEVPETFRLGKILWDTWLASYFGTHFADTCADLTPSRLIYHPDHHERKDQDLETPDDPHLKNMKWPIKSLSI